MEDAGTIASAAAMAVMIFLTSAAVPLVPEVAARSLLRHTQSWRNR
jgi:iron(III) transport system permease protein